MDADRFKRARAVFEKLLEKDPEDWEPCLDTYCGEDRLLRQDIESLLAHHQTAGDFLEEPAPLPACPPADTSRDPMDSPPTLPTTDPGVAFEPITPPKKLGGQYRLLHLIASGGFGQVWAAEDEVLRRRVAIKCLSIRGMPARDLSPEAFRILHGHV